MFRASRWCCGALTLLALLSACATEPAPEADVINDELPAHPPVIREDSPVERAEAVAAPTRASTLAPGECVTQDDCGAGEVCVALAPGDARCMQIAGAQVPSAAPNGRPAPPIGLLDGQMMRDHARGAR